MSKAIEKIKTAFELWNKGKESFDEAGRVLSSGPSAYYFGKIEEYVNALFDRFAPFKKGDRVEIIKAPNTDNSWNHCRHFLIKGAIGTVEDVDYRDNLFVADVVWDIETWISEDGDVKPVKQKHTFLMSENQIAKITAEPNKD